jgi:DMSO reductase family type II enzyme heme b subunit
MRTPIRGLLVVTLVVLASSCVQAPIAVPEVVAMRTAALSDDPDAAVWQQLPEHIAKLLPQDLVEPRTVTPTTQEVRVRAMTNGSQIAFRLEWVDAEVNDLPGAGRFNDACAVQVPQKASVAIPDPQMGMVGNGVQITFWRADWQAAVNGRGESISELYPNASIDHYPFDAPSLEKGSDAQTQSARRYAPADAVGNRRGGARTSAVEDLVAEGPGTITRAATTSSQGRGVRTPTGWAVVITRPVPDGLAPTTRTQVAFAVWEGSAQEAGARKMRSGWIGLAMRETS